MPPSSLGLILFKCISFKIIKIWTFNANIANIKIAIQVSGPWKKWDPDLPIAVSFGKSFPQENVHGLEFKPLKFFTKAQKCSSNRPFIYDTRNLCTRLRTDRIKMSRGFSGGKQVIKCANARNLGRVCIFQPTENEELFILRTIM